MLDVCPKVLMQKGFCAWEFDQIFLHVSFLRGCNFSTDPFAMFIRVYYSSSETPTMYTFIPGQSRLLRPSQNPLEIGIVPTSFKTFRMDANARRGFLVQQIEANVT